MAKVKSLKLSKSRGGLFKALGLLALVFFTFYFIYNYLATGSFSLKPRASEVVTNEVNSCGSLKVEPDCIKYKNQGCSWKVGPSTTKTETVNCTKDEALRGMYGCKITYTEDFVTQTCYRTVTKYTTTITYTYYCSIGSTKSSGDCIRAGGDWLKKENKVNTPYQVQESYSCEKSVTKESFGTGTRTVTVAGVGSCTGTLKPIVQVPQGTPKDPVVGGEPRVVNQPSTSTGTCSAGMTRCGTDQWGLKNSAIEVCSSGNWVPSYKTSGCGENKCEVVNGVAKCKASTPTKVLGCKSGETNVVACTKPGYSKKGVCKSFAGVGVWRYSPCEKNSERVKCETRLVSGGFQWRDPSSKDNKWSGTVKGNLCENVFYDKLSCTQADGDSGARLCIHSGGASDVCSNVGVFGDDCGDKDPEVYGPKSSRDLSTLKNIKCTRDADCNAVGNTNYYKCHHTDNTGYGRCAISTPEKVCNGILKPESCNGYYFDLPWNTNFRCTWNKSRKLCVSVN